MMSKSGGNLKSIAVLISNANAIQERFDKYQKDKSDWGDNFVSIMAQDYKEIMKSTENKKAFETSLKNAIHSVSVANNKRLAKALNSFTHYLYRKDIDLEKFEELKQKVMAIFREEYADDTHSFGTSMLEENMSFFKYLATMVSFLSTKKKELDELEMSGE